MNIDLTPQDRHGASRARHGGRPSVAIDLGSGWKVPRQGCRVGVCECAGRIRGAERSRVRTRAGGEPGRSVWRLRAGRAPARRLRAGREPRPRGGKGCAISAVCRASRGAIARFRAFSSAPERSSAAGPTPHHNTVSFHFCRSHALYPQKIQTPQSSHLARSPAGAHSMRGMPPHGPGRPPKHSHMLRR